MLFIAVNHLCSVGPEDEIDTKTASINITSEKCVLRKWGRMCDLLSSFCSYTLLSSNACTVLVAGR